MSANETESPVSSRSRQFHAAIAETCLPRIDKATVPIIGVQDDSIRHDRTGVLYRIGGDYFVLTAAHSLRAIVESTIPLYISAGKPGVAPMPLADARFCSTEEVGRDVAAIWLPPDFAQEVGKYKEFLSHNQINTNPIKPRTPYVFFGYPMGWSGHVVAEGDVRSMPLVFSTFQHEGERDRLTFYDENIHMLLHCTQQAVNLQRESLDPLPILKGISGCGIWHVADLVGKVLSTRTADTVTLVGIQHRWLIDYNYVQATRIGYVLDLIRFHYPRTTTPMNLVYPPE